MTPPLCWHFLQDSNGRIQVVKNGKESDNGYVKCVQCFEKGGKTALRILFSDGKCKGFTVKGFDFTASRLSRYFHTKGARSNNDVARVWKKYISPSMNPDTGILSSSFGNSEQDSESDESLADQSLNETHVSHTVNVTPSTNSRKRPLTEKTPNIKPFKVTKRVRTTPQENQTSVQEEKELDDAIIRSFIGYYTLPISCLIEPHSDRLLRTAKDCRVEELKKAMKANPSFDSAPIVGLVALNEGESFDESKKETYLYETLGGNHSRAALQSLCEELENPPAAFRTRLVSVYSGLSDDEAYRLASKHNNATSLQHKMSHWEKIQFCRNCLYKMTNTPLTEPTPEKPKCWRSYCAGLLMDEVTTLDDACVFFLASLPSEHYSLVDKIFQLYGKGQLKGQKIKKGSLGMAMDLKASNFKAMRGLDMEMAMTELQGVFKKEMSIQEMIVECRDIKKMKEVQEMFVFETGVSSWSEAEKEFPAFATPDALDEFKKCRIKTMPQRFLDFCQLALKSKVDTPPTSDILGVYSMENSSALVVKQTSLDYGTVTELCTCNGLNCNGFSLVTVNILQHEPEEIKQRLCVSLRCVKAINTTLGRMSFTTVVVCKPFSITMVKCTLQDCGLEGIELGFVDMGDGKVSPGHSLGESVIAIVIGKTGQPSQGAVRKSNCFNSKPHSLKDDAGNPVGETDFRREVYEEIVALYTSPTDWVLNLSMQTEEPAMGCLKKNRNSFNTAEECTLTIIKRQLNKEL